MNTVKLPISVVVIHPPADQQQAVVDAARRLKVPEGRVTFEESPEGLLVHGLTELDIELAIYELGKSILGIRSGKPQVAYDLGPPLEEPYYRATVDVPEQNVGAVMGDLSARRAVIQGTREGPLGIQFIAEVPVSECFGYSASLRALTQGRGSYTVEYAGYRCTPFNNPGPDDAA